MLQMAYGGKKYHKLVDILFSKVCLLLDDETNKTDENSYKTSKCYKNYNEI